MIRLFAGLALLLAAQTARAAPPGSGAGGFVHIEGRHFVNPDGTDYAIKGISLGNWLLPEGYMFKFKHALSPREIDAVFVHLIGRAKTDQFWRDFRDTYVAQDDIAFIRAAGFNTVRVPLHYALFMREGDTPTFEGPGYALIDRLISWCKQVGLHVILDLHAAPGGQTGVNHDDGTGFPLVFYVPKYRAETLALWRHLAARYRDETTVLGYDLLNEPISPYNDEDFLNPQLEPFYRDLVGAVREADKNHPIFLAASQWSTNFAVFGPPFTNNVAYTYHKFWASTHRDSVQDYVDFSARYNVPIFLGEAGELTDRWNAAFRTLNESFGIGWSFWTYKEPDSTSTVVSIPLPPGWTEIAAVGSATSLSSAPVVPPARAETIIQAYLKSIAFARGCVNASYLASLGLAAPKQVTTTKAIGSLQKPLAATPARKI
jgi:aryl-phospho-beta-D-glucosidase BglC (GH1 family)